MASRTDYEDEPVRNVSKKKSKAKKKRNRIIILIAELVVLTVALFICRFLYKGSKSTIVKIDVADLEINEEVATNTAMEGYRNIALFGVDSTTGKLSDDTRTDTIIIASINQETGDVNLVSIYRDTYLNLGNDTYTKCNAAYNKGGAEQAIKMLNTNLDMDITDFVTVGFKGLIDTIDALGGIEIDVTEAEVSHLNNYQYSIAENLKCDYEPVTETGLQTLNGLQATAYCRIRYTAGDDFKRAERQRSVLTKISEKAKTMNASQLSEIANSVFPEIYTSLELSEILELLGEVTKYEVVGSEGFPQADMRGTGKVGGSGSCVIPLDLASNVTWLHEYLFEDEGYEPTETVKKNSAQITSDTSAYLDK